MFLSSSEEKKKRRKKKRATEKAKKKRANSSLTPQKRARRRQRNTRVFKIKHGIESTRARRETRDQATQKHHQRGNDSTFRGHRFGLGAGVGTRHEQRLFKMELPGDAELRAQRDFGARRVQGERERERDFNFFFFSNVKFFVCFVDFVNDDERGWRARLLSSLPFEAEKRRRA